MKRRLLPLILVVTLLGAPAPVQAADNPMAAMARMMLLMMDMFAWMMGDDLNRSWKGYPYAGNYGGFPGMGGMPYGNGLINPYSLSTMGLLSGGGFPYGGTGTTGYPGFGSLGNFPFNRLYPGMQPYGYQGLYGQAYRPGQYGYTGNPYLAYPQRRYPPPARHYSRSREDDKTAKVIVQPVIIQPPSSGSEGSPGGQVTTPPPVTIEVPSDTYDDSYRDHAYGGYPDRRYGNYATNDGVATPLEGEWLGINGEYLMFEGNRFSMTDNRQLLEGRFELKNGIMKAQLLGRDRPVYFKYDLQDGHLMFLAENGQRILFRRMSY